jgi:hypothetical protein
MVIMAVITGWDLTKCQIKCGSEPVIDGRYIRSTPYKMYLGTCILQYGTAVKIENLIAISALLKL